MRRALLLLTLCSALHGQDLEKIFEEDNLEPMRRVLAAGRYDDVALICERAIQQGFKSPDWRIMKGVSMKGVKCFILQDSSF